MTHDVTAQAWDCASQSVAAAVLARDADKVLASLFLAEAESYILIAKHGLVSAILDTLEQVQGAIEVRLTFRENCN